MAHQYKAIVLLLQYLGSRPTDIRINVYNMVLMQMLLWSPLKHALNMHRHNSHDFGHLVFV